MGNRERAPRVRRRHRLRQARTSTLQHFVTICEQFCKTSGAPQGDQRAGGDLAPRGLRSGQAPGYREERQITALLRERHRIRGGAATDDFAIQDQRKLLGAQSDAAASLGAATTKLAFLALFLGGFGILGLMLLNVRDRTPEIGLLMALGARSSDIGLQFLSEATLVSVAGGVLGVGLGLVGARVVSLVTAWPTECSLDVGAAAFAPPPQPRVLIIDDDEEQRAALVPGNRGGTAWG